MSTAVGGGGARSLIIVGSGIAGLYAALAAAERSRAAGEPAATLVTKDRLQDSNTWYAQGGIAAVSPDSEAAGDSVASHIADTLTAGAHAGDPAAVELLCREAWTHVERLIAAGTEFDRAERGFALGLEGAHSHARILHHGGDATGAGIASALIRACRTAEARGRLRILENAFVTDLVQHDDGTVAGVRLLAGGAAGPDGPIRELAGDAVVIATGGIGQLYEFTTNPSGATGDGAALAWRAGARLRDLEFIQFHPTLLDAAAVGTRPPGAQDAPTLMISEAVRGEGAVLLDGAGERFMPSADPRAELSPRDVVARAIHARRRATGGVFLDARGIERSRGAGFLAGRFPGIVASLAAAGLDPARDLIPVAEAQHYWMGGIATDASGRTGVAGLYAVGESACTGVHGANRLASNSLLEGLVFAWRAVDAALAGAAAPAAAPRSRPRRPLRGAPDRAPLPGPGTAELSARLRRVASRHLAVERNARGLREAASEAGRIAAEAERSLGGGESRAVHELANRALLGRLIARAALAREDSLGAHFRNDTGRPDGHRPAPTTPTTSTRTDRGERHAAQPFAAAQHS
ncbi:L-aspartate oxidase [Zhihengliuella salsuginis]|uniref:L-aspartate oxidase n=1 Tax=Zhihengliuella salsuginis TaxID=578222 RepID=A0ABQ3GJC4_9MICC|nr:L-aspartate oxidase [Zhihengliuella salsuginis]GHD08350.1 L-aspartate oxidase [Zhihengliuella salsuginis]